jgi:hypothetical protein
LWFGDNCLTIKIARSNEPETKKKLYKIVGHTPISQWSC